MKKGQVTDIEQFVINRVREKRMEKGWSQRDLAVEVELSHTFLSNVENPNYDSKYNLEHLNRLAKVFECSPKDFLPEQPL